VTQLAIQLKNLSLQHHDKVILENISLDIQCGQFISLLGRSGCGKTTLLKAINRLLKPENILCGQIDFIRPLHSHQIAYMSQNDGLLPWLNILDNLLLFSRLNRLQPNKEAALELLKRIGLENTSHAYPNVLSGGMRQRVALARTLIQNQPIILMDEPFSALDAITRTELQILSKELLKNKTVLMVTHDPSEAVFMSDCIYLLHNKKLSLISEASASPHNHEELMQILLKKDKALA